MQENAFSFMLKNCNGKSDERAFYFIFTSTMEGSFFIKINYCFVKRETAGDDFKAVLRSTGFRKTLKKCFFAG